MLKGLKLGTTTAIATARKVMTLPKLNEKRKRSVVFTGGRDPTVVGWEGQEPFEDAFEPVPKEKIKWETRIEGVYSTERYLYIFFLILSEILSWDE